MTRNRTKTLLGIYLGSGFLDFANQISKQCVTLSPFAGHRATTPDVPRAPFATDTTPPPHGLKIDLWTIFCIKNGPLWKKTLYRMTC
ncbi:hypothetical protein CEXT_776231 [Caerostris extrusa]|uniref:Uncharacterized protein n=1 Tax=Caerostris extrusa TaxID=172846 RepID=A0AAV4N2J1_CAEEX|nr:hypothetical protein CEXT_776231 [Caerostris extrusa]